MANFLCDLPLRFDSIFAMGASAISIVVGLATDAKNVFGIPWAATGAIGLGLAALTAISCPPPRPYVARKICKDQYGRTYFC